MLKRVHFESSWLPYALVTPQIAITLVFFMWPAAQSVYQSFLIEDAFGLSTEFVFLENYQTLFDDPLYFDTFYRTAFFSSMVASLSIGVALMLAGMADLVIKGSLFYRTMLIWPYAVAPAIAGALWVFMFDPTLGILAFALNSFGWDWNHKLNGNEAMGLVIMAATWKQISYNFLFFLAAMQAIPKSLIEAAAIAYNLDSSLTSFSSGDGIEVTITPGPDQFNAEFTIDDLEFSLVDSGTNTVSLVAIVSDAEGTGVQGNDEFAFTGNISLTASVINDKVTLTVKEGSAVAELLGAEEAEKIQLKLTAELAQRASEEVVNPVTFQGTIIFTGVNIRGTGESKDNTAFDSLSLAFSGNISKADDVIGFSLTMVQDGTDYLVTGHPIGTDFEWAYTVEEDGKVFSFIFQDFVRPVPAIDRTERWEFLDPSEVDALGGLPPSILTSPTYSAHLDLHFIA